MHKKSFSVAVFIFYFTFLNSDEEGHDGISKVQNPSKLVRATQNDVIQVSSKICIPNFNIWLNKIRDLLSCLISQMLQWGNRKKENTKFSLIAISNDDFTRCKFLLYSHVCVTNIKVKIEYSVLAWVCSILKINLCFGVMSTFTLNGKETKGEGTEG